MFAVTPRKVPADVTVATKVFKESVFKRENLRLYEVVLGSKVVPTGASETGGAEVQGSNDQLMIEAGESAESQNIGDAQKKDGKQQKKAVIAAERLIIDAFTADITKKGKSVIKIDHTHFLAYDESIDSHEHEVKLHYHCGDDRPDGLHVYQRIVFDRKSNADGKGDVYWVRAERVKVPKVVEQGPPSEDENMDDAPQDEDEYSDDSEQARELDAEMAADLKNRLIVDEKEPDNHTDGNHGVQTFTPSLRETTEKNFLEKAVAGAEKQDPLAMKVVRALLVLQFTSEHSCVFLDNKFFGQVADATLQEVEFRVGVARSLSLTLSGKVMLREKRCDQLFFPATSLASFMQRHCGISVAGADVDIQQHLTDLFRGLQVKVADGYTTGTKTIMSISLLMPEQQLVPAGQTQITLAQLYAQRGLDLVHPVLPCVNIGTLKRPFFVAPELCTILPHQAFKHGSDPTFQRELDIVRRSTILNHDLLGTSLRGDESKGSDYEQRLAPQVFVHTPSGSNWESGEYGHARILLVEVGSTPFRQKTWADFQSVLRQMGTRESKRTSKVSVVDDCDDDTLGRSEIPAQAAAVMKDVIRLKYVPGCEGMTQQWSEEISSAIGESQSQTTPPTTVLFGMEHDANHADIFSKVKEACKDAGCQSVGINLATIREKVDGNPSLGLVQNCGNIYRKIFARTPKLSRPPKPQTRGIDPMAVAIHITEYTRNKDKGRSPAHLVSAVFRAAGSSSMYGSNVELVESAEDLPFATARVVQKAVEQFNVKEAQLPGRLMIFRSGKSLTGQSARQPLNQEWTGVVDILKRVSWTRALAKTGNQFLVTVEGGDRIGPGAAKIVQKTAEGKPEFEHKADKRAPKAICFLNDLGESNEDDTKEHGPMVTLVQSVGKLDVAPAKLTIFRGELELKEEVVEESSTTTKKEKRSPQKAEDQTALLAKLFHDDFLGIYECNLPVPTYLAQRLTGWAASHMKIEQTTKDDGTSGYHKYTVPTIEKAKTRTLWYL